jgi:glutamate racemase
VGGLSVLPSLQRCLPQARLVYAADSGYAPYGERDEAWLQDRSLQMARFLRSRGADLLVVACNTATAAALPHLRAQHTDCAIVGIEPGIKPAVAQSAARRIGVMATEATLRSQRFNRLLAEYADGTQVVAQACQGLAWAIERADAPRIQALVEQHTEPLRQARVDTVVLGCTHYAFARRWIECAMGPEVTLVDTADAVARRAASLVTGSAGQTALLEKLGPAGKLGPLQPLEPTGRDLEMWTSAAPTDLERFALRWLSWSISAQPLGF